MYWKKDFKVITDQGFSVTHILYYFSSHNTRVFINNAETRKLLLKFVKEGLDEKEYCQLQKLISTYQPAMTDLLNDFWESGFAKCPGIYCDLLSVLSSNYQFVVFCIITIESFKYFLIGDFFFKMMTVCFWSKKFLYFSNF